MVDLYCAVKLGDRSGLSGSGWQLLARFRLGIPLTEELCPRCPGCSQAMDALGDHALCCPSLGTYARHNRVRDEVAFLCRDVGLSAAVEVPLPGSRDRPADVLVRGLEDGAAVAAAVAVDVAVSHPLQPSGNLAEVRPGVHARAAEQRKREHRGAACRAAGWELVPFVVETFGVWGPAAREFTQRLVERCALVKEVSAARAAKEITDRLNASVLLGVVRQLERGFLPGAERTTARSDLYAF